LKKYAKKNFPYNFETLEEFIPLEEYRDKISKINVLIMNNIRPQGGGNISLAILEGKKVYLNPLNSHYQLLLNLGIKIYSTDDLFRSSLDEIFIPLNTNQKVSNNLLMTTFLNEVNEGFWNLK
jgi:hypothetical protein